MHTPAFRLTPLSVVAFLAIWFSLLGSSAGGGFASGCGCTRAMVSKALPVQTDPFLQALSDAAIERTGHEVTYDRAYVVIDYPRGDVPADRGTCTDVVIRSYRKLAIDLQQLIHEDMSVAFSQYPQRWGLAAPDTNIDHRRVPNLMTFFQRKGAAMPITLDGRDYKPGDVVAWDLGGGVPHMGIVVADMASDGGRYLVVHNIGDGPQMEDVLFSWEIIGHYRYSGK